MKYTLAHLAAAVVIGSVVGAAAVKIKGTAQPAPQETSVESTATPTSHMMNMGAHDMSMDSMTVTLAGLEGDARDKAFLELMIEHHQGAVDMSELVLESSRPEIREFAQEIINAQEAEITQMQAWLAEWYE